MTDASPDAPGAADGTAAAPLLIEERDGIRRLVLNRPAKRNALNEALKAALQAALDEAHASPPRALVLTGADGAFSAGQDLTERADPASVDLEASLRDVYRPLALALAGLPCPSVAEIAGVASGAGANLALLCDVAVAAEDARFVQPFTGIGLVPDVGGTWTLPRRVGDARARGLVMLGEPVSGAEAERIGLIWKAVPPGDLRREADAAARRLASRPREALLAARHALREAWENDLADQLEREAVIQGRLGRGQAYHEAVRTFLDRRARPRGPHD